MHVGADDRDLPTLVILDARLHSEREGAAGAHVHRLESGTAHHAALEDRHRVRLEIVQDDQFHRPQFGGVAHDAVDELLGSRPPVRGQGVLRVRGHVQVKVARAPGARVVAAELRRLRSIRESTQEPFAPGAVTGHGAPFAPLGADFLDRLLAGAMLQEHAPSQFGDKRIGQRSVVGIAAAKRAPVAAGVEPGVVFTPQRAEGESARVAALVGDLAERLHHASPLRVFHSVEELDPLPDAHLLRRPELRPGVVMGEGEEFRLGWREDQFALLLGNDRKLAAHLESSLRWG